ncbi:MAG: sulfotransferase domain-containing protein [Pseudomonadales bacterium]|nr:sulfotransferase domain-containing protein [Pseudomonadales bacterium]
MNQVTKPENTQHYSSFIMDSSRWQNFEPRADDIVICTPPKCGTTWMQMICALLIFQKITFDRPLSEYSPWLDMLIQPIDDVLNQLQSQTNRRFIKTHTPLDGLPYYDDLTYLCVARDPRDAFLSMQAHQRNINPEIMQKIVANISAPITPPAPQPEDLGERFRNWISASGKPGDANDAISSSVINYVQTFWQYRHLPNIHFFHYADLQSDLSSEMTRAANLLNIDIDPDHLPELVAAASFASMKGNADNIAPDAENGIWNNNAGFFNSGSSGQWQDVLSEEDIAVYHQQMATRLPPELAHWLEFGGKLPQAS